MPSHPDRVRENYERRVYADKVQDHVVEAVTVRALSEAELCARIAHTKQQFNVYIVEALRRLRARA